MELMEKTENCMKTQRVASMAGIMGTVGWNEVGWLCMLPAMPHYSIVISYHVQVPTSLEVLYLI
jgi:hypothetical protein